MSQAQSPRISTPSLSPSGTRSITETTSQARTRTQTPSALLPGESRSGTPTPSPTTTPAPYELVFAPPEGGGGTAADGSLLLSDSLPPATLTAVLNRCPSIPAQLTATVSCDVASSGEGGSPLLVSYIPAPMMTFACSSTEVGYDLAFPAKIQLLPQYGTPSYAAAVSCNLTGADGTAMGSTATDVSVTATLWPVFDDVIIVSSNGFSRSVGGVGPGKVNSTNALLEAAGLQRRGLLPSTALTSSDTGARPGLASALSNMAAVLAAMQQEWSGVEVPLDAARPFSLTLFGSTPFVLRSRQRAFAAGTSVFISSVRCNGTVVSADGEWLATAAPDPALLCSGATAGSTSSCAYAPIVVRNPPVVPLPSGDVLGASLSCPPFCSGAVGGGTFPLAPARGSAFVLALVDAPSGAARPIDLTTTATATVALGVLALRVSAIASSSGLFYSQACADSGIFTDPSTGACTNASDPAFSLCAFGGGAACRSCPTGAACPGGFRAWPQPGYWSPIESSTVVAPCVRPDALRKCLGWSAALGAAQCGAAYRQGSYLCSGE